MFKEIGSEWDLKLQNETKIKKKKIRNNERHITKIGEFHACWHAVVAGQVHGTSVSHVDQVELVHPMLIRMRHVTVFEYVFCILRNIKVLVI